MLRVAGAQVLLDFQGWLNIADGSPGQYLTMLISRVPYTRQMLTTEILPYLGYRKSSAIVRMAFGYQYPRAMQLVTQ